MNNISSLYVSLLWGVILAFVLFPSLVFAGPIVRSGDSVSVEADQVLEGDFYGVGGDVSLSGTAENDVYIAAGTVTVNAPVAEDLVIAGGTVQIHAPVGDDLRIVGGDVTLASSVAGDVLVAGGVVTILSTAQIEGDLLFATAEIDVSGGVRGSIVGTADLVRVDAGIGGDIDVTAANTFALGDRAEVLGNVTYRSHNELARAQGAVVVGDMHRGTLERQHGFQKYTILPLLTMLFAALLAFLLFRKPLQHVTNTTKERYGIQGLIGLLVLIVLPVTAVLLFVSVLGFIPGLIVLIGYFLLLLVAWVSTGIIFGTLLLQPFMKTSKISIMSIIVGVVLFDLIVFIPYLGPLLAAALFLIVLGGFSKRLYDLFRLL